MTGLPGSEGSRVVLIGVPKYREDVFADIPGVANNVAELRRLLADPLVWGIPEENICRVDEQAGPSEVLDRIHTSAVEATEALIVYFAGHGLADRDGLRLMLSGSSPGRRWTALSYRDIRDLLLDHGSQAAWKTVILDCCFAGAAFDGTLSAADQITDLAAIRGTCVLTACGETEFAWAPPEDRYTAFSGELIRLLGQGVTGGPEFLDVEAIYHRARSGLRAIGGPEPQWRVHEDGARAVLARNRAWRAASPAKTATASSPPPPRLRREGIDVHIRLKKDGCFGIAGDTAYFETERALIGIDLRGGAVAWARPLGEDDQVVDYNNCLQIIDETGTSLLDPATGAVSFRRADGGVHLAMISVSGTTMMVGFDDDGDTVQRLSGVSAEDGSLIWEYEGDFNDPSGFIADGLGRTWELATADGTGRLIRLELRGGVRHETGIEAVDSASGDITSDGLMWVLTRAEDRASLTVKSLVDGSTRLSLTDFTVPGLDTTLSWRNRGELSRLLKSPQTHELVIADERSKAAAIWLGARGLSTAALWAPDDLIENLGTYRAMLGRADGHTMTRIHDRDGRLVSSHDRHFWRVDEFTAISAPRIPADDGVPVTSRVALLDVPTGRVTELGSVTTFGGAVWSRTHLAAPTPDGVRIWRYRD
ncbi:caspase, EACC1-associated type [Phytomonospora endophytica]|uniref:Peptidase C14 caspase domain-containing protein n=1 Tax=Phytomonospora endophytica TaxID=714109 RepID=A0A841FD52_9ACTN|nr:caspase family protein [Phytomonospora endophytica]MBB6034206.1 hypothetical protein [Phytomonospora endophytica]GIG66598.1 hypothetical protein Pen01_28930 [Phytomonospora endophytica]